MERILERTPLLGRQSDEEGQGTGASDHVSLP